MPDRQQVYLQLERAKTNLEKLFALEVQEKICITLLDQAQLKTVALSLSNDPAERLWFEEALSTLVAYTKHPSLRYSKQAMFDKAYLTPAGRARKLFRHVRRAFRQAFEMSGPYGRMGVDDGPDGLGGLPKDIMPPLSFYEQSQFVNSIGWYGLTRLYDGFQEDGLYFEGHVFLYAAGIKASPHTTIDYVVGKYIIGVDYHKQEEALRNARRYLAIDQDDDGDSESGRRYYEDQEYVEDHGRHDERNEYLTNLVRDAFDHSKPMGDAFIAWDCPEFGFLTSALLCSSYMADWVETRYPDTPAFSRLLE